MRKIFTIQAQASRYRYKFNGKELDPETGWYYYGALSTREESHDEYSNSKIQSIPIMQKIIITPNEVAALLEKSEGYGRRIIREIKFSLGRSKNQYVTIGEFCNYFGFQKEEVLHGLGRNKK